MNTVALVACAAKKQPQPAPARELYVSPWFRFARAYVEAQGWPWFILSARHGLLNPSQVIEPYNLTLSRLSPKLRLLWALDVGCRIQKLPWPERIVILAGERYREHLVPELRDRRYIVEVPMTGLGIGQQMKWLKEHTQ